MSSDLRYAVRTLARSRGFTLAALTVLALGIGSTTAMFSAVNAVLLRPMPFPAADRLFVVRETRAHAGFERTVVASGEYLQWRRDNPLFEHAAVIGTPSLAIRLGESAERVPALRVPADFFPLFGVTPVLGRAFGPEAEQPGHGDVILLGYDVWQRRLNGAADAIGRTVTVEGRPAVVIGVLPKFLSFVARIDAIVPMTLGAEQAAEFSSHSLDMFVRLAAGVTPEQAAADLTRQVLATQGSPAHATGVTLVPLRDEMVGDARTSLLTLFGAVGLVLLIACANIANLLLARATARQQELALRSALGATRRRLVRQLITESLLLAGVGGAFGVVLASWLIDLLRGAAADSIPRALEIGMDARALAFAAALSALCGVVFGVVPAWQAARFDPALTLKRAGRSGTARTCLLSAFAAAEIALALVLLIGAGLLLSTFRNLRRVDAGFDPSNVMTAPAYLPDWKYGTPEAQRAFFVRLISDLEQAPGVTAAAAVNVLPLSGSNSSGSVTVEGFPPPPPDQRESADRRTVTPSYFAAMGIRLRQGRAFTPADDERAAAVVIVSRSFAERYWPGGSPIGKRLKLGQYASEAPWRTIVGVAADVRHRTLAAASRQAVYMPHAQLPENVMEIVVRGQAGPQGLAAAIRGAVTRLDSTLPVDAIVPMREIVRASLFDRELEAMVLGAFAALAVILAAAGVFGVMSYSVAQRVKEFGIRVALGATGGDILREVVQYGLRLTAAGVAIGLAAAWLAQSALRDLLYGVQPTEPVVLASTAGVLAAVALAACLLPARRALSVDPITALRAD